MQNTSLSIPLLVYVVQHSDLVLNQQKILVNIIITEASQAKIITCLLTLKLLKGKSFSLPSLTDKSHDNELLLV